MHYFSLYLHHLVYFIMLGASSFLPKLYGEMGLSNGQIGVLSSLPTLFALVLMPMFGTMSDRVPLKRYLLFALLLLLAGSCALAYYSEGFLLLFAATTLYTIFSNAARPVTAAISLEYTHKIGKQYGPVRLFGSIGYQIGALLVGYIMSRSLKSLYPMMAVTTLLAAGTVLIMPDVKGHQHKRTKVPFTRIFADRHLCWLYVLILLCGIGYQFHASFFTKYLGDLGMSNSVISWITVLGVMAELPFFFFGDKIARMTNIWNWMMIGMLLCALRWIGQAYATSPLLIIILQLPGVAITACLDFFPSIYLSRRVSDEQLGTAQSLLTLTTFGAARVIGSLIGGKVCEYVSISTVFLANGVFLLAVCALLWLPTRRLIRKDTVPKLT